MGQNVSNQFNKLGDEIYKCDWYLFPHKLQRMLVIIMINAQEPVSIRGFGNVVCTRDSFKQVIFSRNIDSIEFDRAKYSVPFQTTHAGFSYFMMLYQVDN